MDIANEMDDLTDNVDGETSQLEESENVNSEPTLSNEKQNFASKTETVRFTKLPMARIKSIMKMDPDVVLASNEAVFVVTKAVELFIDSIAKEAYSFTAKSKKKTVTKKDLDTVIDSVDCLLPMSDTATCALVERCRANIFLVQLSGYTELDGKHSAKASMRQLYTLYGAINSGGSYAYGPVKVVREGTHSFTPVPNGEVVGEGMPVPFFFNQKK